MKFLKSRDFPIHLLWLWWIFWFFLSCTDLNWFLPMSPATKAQFMLFIISFMVGHLAIKYWNLIWFTSTFTKSIPTTRKPKAFILNLAKIRLILYGSALSNTLLLLICLHLSGAFDATFVEYFTKVRLGATELQELTGNHYLDVLTKLLIFPISFTIILVILGNDIQDLKSVLIICMLNLLGFCYLWQVNYPIVQMFWVIFYYFLISSEGISKTWILVTIALFFTLLASAANRFGGDLFGAFQRYIVGYHLIGFSFYDHQYQNSNSILHSLTYGRSSLGFLEQALEIILKNFGMDFISASSENSTYNNEDIDIGLTEIKLFNAFGTILFSLYRDFHFVGIIIGGFLYGAFVTHSRYYSARRWVFKSIFLLLASAWMIGMMVSPLEQTYFWFVVVMLIFFVIVSRSVNR